MATFISAQPPLTSLQLLSGVVAAWFFRTTWCLERSHAHQVDEQIGVVLHIHRVDEELTDVEQLEEALAPVELMGDMVPK